MNVEGVVVVVYHEDGDLARWKVHGAVGNIARHADVGQFDKRRQLRSADDERLIDVNDGTSFRLERL